LSDRATTLRNIQRQIEDFYGLESAPDVTHFVQQGATDSREVLLLRQGQDELELALVLPELLPHATSVSSDTWLQMLEGVSHFVYIAERARMELPITQLELELQAEVDKFVLLALDPNEAERTGSLHTRLFEGVRFLHPPESELGERYRLAHRLAARFLARTVTHNEKLSTLPRGKLREFYRAGQAEKIRLAQAA
jgi:hypothetical protein